MIKKALKELISAYLKSNQAENLTDGFKVAPLSPDGSDRIYYRITAPGMTPFIATDAGGCGQKNKHSGLSQNNSFRLIQQHLEQLNFPAAKYLYRDAYGDDLYLLQDLGDTTLYHFVKKEGWNGKTIALYENVLSLLLRLQLEAAPTFDPNWAYAGGFYDYDLIVAGELNYFLKAFVTGYCRIKLTSDECLQLQAEFKLLAESAMQAPADFFLYRDFQSKNLMLHQDKIFLIDFQGARLGPVYYDLAALINDPYTEIPLPLREELKNFYFDKLKETANRKPPGPENFNFYFTLFSLIRTLQTLGAFGYLSGCGKKHFAQYIKPALANLDYYLDQLNHHTADFNLNSLILINRKIEL